MNQNDSLNRKRKRELEIAANFQKVLNYLPVDFFHAFLNAIIEYNDRENTKLVSSFEIFREKNIFGEGDSRRADVGISLSPNLTKVVFEFKLGKEDLQQVIGYADSLDRTIIVSIAKETNRIDDQRIIQLTWNELFNGLLKIASSEVRERLIPLDSNENFSPGFPDRRLGEPALSFLEDFLFTIRGENLVSFKGVRVMVVAGNMATQTTKNHNVYWFGNKWDKDFQYLVVVNGSTIQYIGEVTVRYFELKSFDEITDKGHKQLIKHAFDEQKERDSFNGQPIVILKSIFEEKRNWKYKEKGAITQSHRYFGSLDNVLKEFKSE